MESNETRKEKFSTCNTLPIHESDEDWEFSLKQAEEEGEDLISRLKEELEEAKDVLLQILPDRFIPYVKNGTLNQPTLPKSVRDDYLQWMREADKEFEHILDAAHEQTANAVTFYQRKSRMSLRKACTIQALIASYEKAIHFTCTSIQTEVSTKALIQFTFENVLAEEFEVPLEVGHWIVYYELQKTEDGFAFRVLFDYPDSEWTIL